MRLLLITLGLLAGMAAQPPAFASQPTVSPYEFSHATVGLWKYDTQRLFDTRGAWVAGYRGPEQDGTLGHLWRNYPASDGEWVQVRYTKSVTQRHWRIRTITRCATYHQPCEGSS